MWTFTGVAALRSGRTFIGSSDCNAGYVELSRDRPLREG